MAALAATITRGTPAQPGSSLPVSVANQAPVTCTLVFTSDSADPDVTIVQIGRTACFQVPVADNMQSLVGQVIAGLGAVTTCSFVENYSFSGQTFPTVDDANGFATADFNTTTPTSTPPGSVIDIWVKTSSGVVLKTGAGITVAANGTTVVEVSPLLSNAVIANDGS